MNPYEIRATSPDLLADDLAAGRIKLHPDVTQDLPQDIGQVIDFFVATSPAGDPRGQIGVRWVGPGSSELRGALELSEGEVAPNVAFMEVFEGQRQGVGRALLATVYQEARQRGHRRIFLSVAAGNVAARTLYDSEGFVDTGFRRDQEQYDRSEDGTYGAPVVKRMEYLYRDL